MVFARQLKESFILVWKYLNFGGQVYERQRYSFGYGIHCTVHCRNDIRNNNISLDLNMIALEFIGTITDDAQVSTTADNKKELTFPVDVKRGTDKDGLDKSIVIYCKKKGTCSSDKRIVRGQKIFVRGDITPSLKRVCMGVNRVIIECTIWQFELL